MTLAEIATVVGAPPPAENPTVTSVEFDSRAVTPGALFVALPGEHGDGHDYAGAAQAAGAVAVLGSRPVPELPTLVVEDQPGSSVEDAAGPALTALSALAHHVAITLIDAGLTVVGVTGSAGKTSTKDLIAAVLARAGTVIAPPESFNNELGHPYTVLRAGCDTDYLVLELSARGIGHIAALTQIAPPRIGAVLNVGSAHLGEFGSREAIAVAKGELVEALPPADRGGIAILNADDEHVAAMAARTAAQVVRTSIHGPADVRATDITMDAQARAHFTLITPEASAPVALRVVGEHQLANALAAAAVGRAVGLPVGTVAEALSESEPASKWRMEVTDLPQGVTVINDAYNANPESMRAALAALERIGAGRRRWAVLGEMAELGDSDGTVHREIGALAHRGGAQVVAVGAVGAAIADGADAASPAGPAALRYDTVADAIAGLESLIRPGDAVLVKASRAVGLERAALALVEELPSILAGASAGDDEERA